MDRFATLLTELRERFHPEDDVREVEIYLASRGYDARQIGEILALYVTDVDGPGGAMIHPGNPGGALTHHRAEPFRIMAQHERARFAPDAWGHLVGLVAAGILSPADREHVIERAIMQTDGRIGVDELRALLESAGFDENGLPGSTTIH
jgi:uncharacterized protein Smg (DUF494 family)